MQVHDIHRTELLLLLLMGFTALLGAAAQRLKLPYPILMVLGGLALSLLPVFPDVALNPTLVFLVILPPLLYSAALGTSWREFRANIVSILTLAFGAVGFTVLGVAVAVHLVLPDFDLETGAVLGAVVAATDAIAASAIGRRVGLPRELMDLIEGESLVNDAAGLLALQYSVQLAVAHTAPTWGEGVRDLLLLIAGGVGAGFAVGVPAAMFQRPMQSSALQTLVSLLAPYVSYLLGESLHGSGVLATVTCGLYVGRKSSLALTSEARLEARAVWNTLDFGLNGIVFVLIGLQLPHVLDGMRPLRWTELLLGAGFISVLVFALRLLWIYPSGYLLSALRKRRLGREAQPLGPRKALVVGWAGMRGVLTLAAALSLPETTETGAPFPHRAGILFLAFAAILVSLTGQGLTLPWIIRKLGVSASPRAREEERWARRQMVAAALKALTGLRSGSEAEDEAAAALMEGLYRQRLEALSDGQGSAPQASPKQRQAAWIALSHRLRQAERQELSSLDRDGRIGGENYRKLERELDLLDLRFPGS